MRSTTTVLAGRYRLGAELGRGGMSTVYRAVDTQTGDDVAVKVYAAGAADDARTRQQREALMSGALAHDGIVRLLDHGVTDELSGDPGHAFLVTELVEGPTLRQRIGGDTLTADQVRILGARLASAMGYLHANGIVHRDIKPANVLLPGFTDDDLGRAVLVDLGVAIRIADPRVTVEGCVVGTATYLSPEQVSGGPITSASDVYALGLLLLEMLTGVASFEGSGVECALARLHRPPDVPATAPQWLAALLAAMTAMVPEERPSADAVELALREGSAAPIPTGHQTAILNVATTEPASLVFAQPDAETSVLTIVPPRGNKRWLVGAGAAAAFVTLFAIAASTGQSTGSSQSWPPAAHTPTTSAPSTAASTPALARTSKAPVVAVVKKSTPPPGPGPAGPGGHRPGKKHGHGGD